MPPIVHFDKVTKSYGGVPAVDGLDLKVEPGKFITLLGPSGCGKSTTLRMLGGFEMPDAGTIYLGGADVTRLPPNRRNVNIVFQDYALFPHMSVAKNIAFGLELKGWASARIHERVMELLSLVQLEDFAGRMPAQLSGGQRQRVALMRALAPDPAVLLLDEPLSALDAKLRQQMQIELKSIQEKTGKTFIFVTHDQEEALTMSDVIVIMNKGRIEQMGDPHSLYSRPNNRFVANFIGETNFLQGRVMALEDRIAVLQWGDTEVRATVGSHPLRIGELANVAVRPEAILCSARKPAKGNAIEGTVTHRIFKGNHTSLTLALPDNRSIHAMADPQALGQLSNDRVWISWSEDRAVVLAD
ncbi:MAG: ABC transporter ATP-binding protein [Phyllobacterium sp.]